MSEKPELETLKKENERLKKRIKTLERRLARTRGIHEQNEELQEELEVLEELHKPKKEPKRAAHEICPKCGGTLIKIDAGPNIIWMCNRAECKHRKVIKKKDW